MGVRSMPAPMKRSRRPGHSWSSRADVVMTMWCRWTSWALTGTPSASTTLNLAPFRPKAPVGRGIPEVGKPWTSWPGPRVKGPYRNVWVIVSPPPGGAFTSGSHADAIRTAETRIAPTSVLRRTISLSISFIPLGRCPADDHTLHHQWPEGKRHYEGSPGMGRSERARDAEEIPGVLGEPVAAEHDVLASGVEVAVAAA